MKKINSINYGGKILGAGTLLTVGIPIALKMIQNATGWSILDGIITASLIAGGSVLLFMGVMLAIELHQDKKLDKFYQSQRNTRRPLDDGFYECANCGNRKVRPADASCPNCGVRFVK